MPNLVVYLVVRFRIEPVNQLVHLLPIKPVTGELRVDVRLKILVDDETMMFPVQLLEPVDHPEALPAEETVYGLSADTGMCEQVSQSP